MADKRISVVTGGSSGIGQATALKLAQAGDRIVIADVNEEAGQAVVQEIAAAGGEASFLSLDVSDEDAVDAAFDKIDRDLGRVGALVNSAGLLENAATTGKTEMALHDRIWAVNYNGTLLCSRKAAALMERQDADGGGGSIMMLGSINSFRALPLPAYNPGKVAIKGLVELMAAELGPKGIRVNGVAPGYTMTKPIADKIAAGLRDPKAIMASCALDHFVTPEDIADAIQFLCSDAARAITGVMLPVDSGWLAASTYNHFPATPDG